MTFDFKAAREAIDAYDGAEKTLAEAIASADTAFATVMDFVVKAIADKVSIVKFETGTGLSHGKVQRLFTTGAAVAKYAPSVAEMRGLDTAVRAYVKANGSVEYRILLGEHKTLETFMKALRKPATAKTAAEKSAEDLLKSAVSSLSKALDADTVDAEAYATHLTNLIRVVNVLKAQNAPEAETADADEAEATPEADAA